MQIHKSGSAFDHESGLGHGFFMQTPFFFVFFLISDWGDSLEAAVLLALDLSVRKCLFSEISWSLPHETCPSSDVTSCTRFAETDSWAFPLVHSSVSSSKFWLPVPHLVKILFLPGFLGKRLLRAAVSICLACLGFWLYPDYFLIGKRSTGLQMQGKPLKRAGRKFVEMSEHFLSCAWECRAWHMCVCDSTCLYFYSHCDKVSLSASLGCVQRHYTYGVNTDLGISSCTPFPVSCSIAEGNLSLKLWT